MKLKDVKWYIGIKTEDGKKEWIALQKRKDNLQQINDYLLKNNVRLVKVQSSEEVLFDNIVTYNNRFRNEIYQVMSLKLLLKDAITKYCQAREFNQKENAELIESICNGLKLAHICIDREL